MNRRKLPEGRFTAWRVGKREVGAGIMKVLVKLEVPANAIRCLPRGENHGKFRVSRAKVVSITALEYQANGHYTKNPERTYKRCLNFFHNAPKKRMRYVVGTFAVPKEPFDRDPGRRCGSGIHAFLTEAEALAYAADW